MSKPNDDSPEPYVLPQWERMLSPIHRKLTDMDVRMARLEERIGPVVKVVYGIVSLGMMALGTAIIALVLKK